MAEEKTKYFTMRIPLDLRRTIKRHCADNEITMKEFCNAALRHYLVVSCNNLSKVQDQLLEEDANNEN